MVYEGQNSNGYKIPYKNSYVYVKVCTIPDTLVVLNSKELLKLCNLNHKNIIKVFDIVLISDEGLHSPKQLIVISEYLQNMDFLDVLTTIHESSAKTRGFIEAILDAYAELHSNGILHYDVNIFNLSYKHVEGNVVPMLIDLNFVTPRQKAQLFCSPEFLAPETHSFDTYTSKSELWAVGVLLYFILTFNFPFGSRLKGLTIEEIIEKIRDNKASINLNLIKKEYRTVIAELLCRLPENRLADFNSIKMLIQKN
jgi:serine/threonine protein kinase